MGINMQLFHKEVILLFMLLWKQHLYPLVTV